MLGSLRRGAAISSIRPAQNLLPLADDPSGRSCELDVVIDAAAPHPVQATDTELLEKARQGAVRALIDLMAFTKPQAFGRAQRIAQVVQELAQELGIGKRWDVDVAGVLAQLATVNLSATILDKLDRGMPLSSDERLTMVRVPSMSAQLLTHIPGLEALSAAIAAFGRATTDRRHAEQSATEQEPLSLLPAMIRVAVDFDHLACGRVPVITAIAQLRRRELYTERVLDALERAYLPKASTDAPEEVTVDALEPGMVLAIDVTTTDEVLLVSRGATVTDAMIRRLSNFAERGECTDRVLVTAGHGGEE